MTGEVAGLFPKDELDGLLNDLRPAYNKEHTGEPVPEAWLWHPRTHGNLWSLTHLVLPGGMDTVENLHRFLLLRVRANLHVILCQSPVGPQFARRAQQFPGLVQGCTIDWFLPWPEQALSSVASKYLDGLSMACSDTVRYSSNQMYSCRLWLSLATA